MPRDTVVSWKTVALVVLVPPLFVVAVVIFPLTLFVAGWLYYRGRERARRERSDEGTFDEQ
jgi:hypothetical protein